MRAAVALMAEDGYEGTSTRDIANAVGVSVAALYYHFPSKQDLLREFLHEAHDVVLARLTRVLEETGPDPRARLDAVVSTLLWSNLHDEWARKAAHVAWREHGRLEEPDRKLIVKKIGQMVDVVEGVITEGIEAGVFRTTEPGDVARAVLTLCIGVVDPFPPVDRSMAKAIEQHQRFAAALADTLPKADETGRAAGARAKSGGRKRMAP
jgi:AcrR family transcriptional regulator